MRTSKAAILNSTKVRIVEPYPITHRFKAGAEFQGCTISEMMYTRFPYRSLKDWNRLFGVGRLGIEGQELTSDYKLKADDQVFHFNPRVIEPAVPDSVEVIQEAEDFIVVKKPAPMPMHPGGRYNKNSLTEILKSKGWNDLRIVHRLDAVTSGIVLLAKSKEFAKKVTHEFEGGRVKKKYAALVAGKPSEHETKIISDIRRKSGFVFESGPNLENAKSAETRFRVAHQNTDSAIIDCNPITGRTHQIRLHLKEWGYPIIDDPIYGPDGDESSVLMQNVGVSLWNVFLGIPELGIEAEIKIPVDWFSKQ